MASRRKQPKYMGYAAPRTMEPREPIDAKALKETHIRQAVRLMQIRVESLSELVEHGLWGSLVEGARGVVEGGRVLLEEAVVREAIDGIERGVYAPIEPKK
jgi:hypothetical protein